MSLGLFDLPAPLLDLADDALAMMRLPALVRVALTAFASGWLSMLIYRGCSNQPALETLRTEIRALQQRLLAGADDYAQTQSLVRRNLALSFRQLGLTLGPALLASVPLLFVLPWLSNRFDVLAWPEVRACVVPAQAAATLHWQNTVTPAEDGCWTLHVDAAQAPRLMQGDTVLFTLPAVPHAQRITKPGWLDWLVANPDGTLPATAAIDAVQIGWPAREMMPFGPDWLRSWTASYFIVLLATSLWLRRRWRLR